MDLSLNFSLHPSVPKSVARRARLSPMTGPTAVSCIRIALPFLRPDLYSTLAKHYFRGFCALEGQFLFRLLVRKIGA